MDSKCARKIRLHITQEPISSLVHVVVLLHDVMAPPHSMLVEDLIHEASDTSN